MFRCVEINTLSLKRRDFDPIETPTQFKQVQLVKQINDNIGFFETPIKQANVVYSPEDVTLIPGQPPPTIVVEQQPVDITPVPPKIEVEVTENYFSYFVKNNSSLRSLIFKFTDASGASVQKSLSAGQTTTICALENSISVNETDTVSNTRPKSGLFAKINEKVSKLDYSINKLKNCKTIDIGEGAPKILSDYTIPPKVKPPVLSSGGGSGVTRDEAAASTNQIITPRGTAISTATASGMAQELPSALQPSTRTDVRQTSITGPTIN